METWKAVAAWGMGRIPRHCLKVDDTVYKSVGTDKIHLLNTYLTTARVGNLWAKGRHYFLGQLLPPPQTFLFSPST